MSFKGDLSTIGLGEVFQMISMSQKEGTLIVQDSESRKCVFFGATGVQLLSSGKRKAYARNERSANAPKTVAEYKASHGPGCGCCSTRPSRIVKQASNGAKSFPTARPWMISH